MAIDIQNLPGTGFKFCKNCCLQKNMSDFSNHPGTKDRLRPKCKNCRSEEYKKTKKPCLVPNYDKMIDYRSMRCIKHSNIKTFYDVPDNELDDIVPKSKTKSYFNQLAREYRLQGKAKRPCPALNCNFLIKKRDSYSCQKCSSTEGLHAHHILSKAKHPELIFELKNGITLCCTCHKLEHKINGLL